MEMVYASTFNNAPGHQIQDVHDLSWQLLQLLATGFASEKEEERWHGQCLIDIISCTISVQKSQAIVDDQWPRVRSG